VSFYVAECLLLEGTFIHDKPNLHAAVTLYWAVHFVFRTSLTPEVKKVLGFEERDLLSYAPVILAATFPKFKPTGVQKLYFAAHPKLIERTFRSKTLKDWVKRKCEQFGKTGSPAPSGSSQSSM